MVKIRKACVQRRQSEDITIIITINIIIINIESSIPSEDKKGRAEEAK